MLVPTLQRWAVRFDLWCLCCLCTVCDWFIEENAILILRQMNNHNSFMCFPWMFVSWIRTLVCYECKNSLQPALPSKMQVLVCMTQLIPVCLISSTFRCWIWEYVVSYVWGKVLHDIVSSWGVWVFALVGRFHTIVLFGKTAQHWCCRFARLCLAHICRSLWRNGVVQSWYS